MRLRPRALLASPLLCAYLVNATIACDSTPDVDEGMVGSPMPRNGQPPITEIFRYSTSRDLIANTNASTNPILAPSPAGIVPLDDPAISDGAMIAFKLHDDDDQLVGFGTEQEVLDMVDASSETTYTLTLPGRGTLMLAQLEDFAPLFAEIGDMLADGELVRDYDPPLSVITTKPQTGRIIGGTGEFLGARGSWTELDVVHRFDLVGRTFDIDGVLEITFDEDEDQQ